MRAGGLFDYNQKLDHGNHVASGSVLVGLVAGVDGQLIQVAHGDKGHIALKDSSVNRPFWSCSELGLAGVHCSRGGGGGNCVLPFFPGARLASGACA